jgi:hypothetical protein
MSNTNRPNQFYTARTRYGSFNVFRVVGFFEVAAYGRLPFGRFTLKIIDLENGELQASPNVQVYNSETKRIEHVCGLGRSVEEAVNSAIDLFMSETAKQQMNKPRQDLDESDFVWLNWQPYVQLTMPPTFRGMKNKPRRPR